MKNNKGFTLIELLAVIVILAIIAVIATPIILNVINDSKKAAAKASAYGALDAIRTYYATSQIGSTPVTGTLTINFATPDDVAKLTMSGKKPSSGTVTFVAGTFSVTDLVVDSYTCSWDSTYQTFTGCS